MPKDKAICQSVNKKTCDNMKQLLIENNTLNAIFLAGSKNILSFNPNSNFNHSNIIIIIIQIMMIQIMMEARFVLFYGLDAYPLF